MKNKNIERWSPWLLLIGIVVLWQVLTSGGKHPIALPNGESRTFLEDGDAVVLRGWCEQAGAARIGFGECWGQVLPARA